MNKYQKAINQIIRSDKSSWLFNYRDNKEMLKACTHKFTFKDIIEYKQWRKETFGNTRGK